MTQKQYGKAIKIIWAPLFVIKNTLFFHYSSDPDGGVLGALGEAQN